MQPLKALKSYLKRTAYAVSDLANAAHGPIDFGSLSNLSDLHEILPRIRISRPPDDVPGWLTVNEQRALYALARWAPGPILEIGPWLGRSTICIAKGIIDAGVTKEFITCELAPKPENFRLVGENNIGFFYPSESSTSMGFVTTEVFKRDIEPFINHPTGVISLLETNLEKYGVSHIPAIFVGDFRRRPPQPFGFVFSDAMHDEIEIARNVEDLRKLLAPGTIPACHDTSPENRLLLERYFKLRNVFMADSLLVGEIESV